MEDLVDGLFPAGKVHLLGGAAGAGKTTLLAWMLKKIKAGEELFGRRTRPPKAIYYVAADQDWAAYSAVLGKAGLSIDGHYSFADDPTMTYTRFGSREPVPLLRFGVQQVKPVPGSLVVVDIFSVFLGDDLRLYRQIMSRMWEYNRMVTELGVTLIGSVHAGKQKAGDAERYVRLFDRVMGGGPMRASASTACYLTSREEAGNVGYQLFEIGPRLETASTYRMDWDAAGLLVPVGEAVQKLDEKHRQVLDLVPFEGIAAGLLVTSAESIGISRATLYRILEQLKLQGMVAKNGSGHYADWVRLREN